MRRIVKQERAIVLVGRFNPSIFQPQWLARHKLVTPTEAEQAKVAVIHNDVSDFSLEWCRVLVMSEKFQLSTLQDGHAEELRDLAVSIFQLLSHTHVTALGLNASGHFECESEVAWHTIGHKLAPKAGIWDDVLTRPGTLSLTVEGVRPDAYKGKIFVPTGPSPTQVLKNGVGVHVTDHYDFTPDQTNDGAREAVSRIQNEWNASNARFQAIIDKVRSL